MTCLAWSNINHSSIMSLLPLLMRMTIMMQMMQRYTDLSCSNRYGPQIHKIMRLWKKTRQDAQLSQRDRAAGYISSGRKWKTAATTRFSPEGIGCQKQTAPKFCQHLIRWAFTSQAFTRWCHLSTHPINRPATLLSTLEGWKAELPSLLTCSRRFTHIVVTRLLQAERRHGQFAGQTGLPPTVLRNQPMLCGIV